MIHQFTCSVCNENKTHDSDTTTGYARDKDDNKVCFDCCGKQDAITLEQLQPKEKFWMYLDTKEMTLQNWPGTFKIKIGYIRTGRHNIAGKRFDVWFRYKDNNYHAVQYGEKTQVAHIQRTKERIIN